MSLGPNIDMTSYYSSTTSFNYVPPYLKSRYMTPQELHMILESSPRSTKGVKPKSDPTIYGNNEAFMIAFKDRDWAPSIDKFIKIQNDDKAFNYRSEVIDNLWNICNDKKCDDVVFPMAVIIYDRYACNAKILPSENMAIGLACLLISSKMNMPKPIKESHVANCLITKEIIIEKEFQVCKGLQFEFSKPTPLEFFEHLVAVEPYYAQFRKAFTKSLYILYKNPQCGMSHPELQATAVVRHLTSDAASLKKIHGTSF